MEVGEGSWFMESYEQQPTVLHEPSHLMDWPVVCEVSDVVQHAKAI